ncbi:MAG TPA: Flp family type IVb pilin [bacterium]|nr:Flp family type IVb pilin [bacterium]HOL46691.1 Flp family type IVb pilin [bacterium]HPQ18379.1 Flp family type IVb pilin [bacterium]
MKIKRSEKGQGIVEYGLIVALIALIVLGIAVNLGESYAPKLKIFILEKYKSNKTLFQK